MSWNSIGDGRRNAALVVAWKRPDGDLERVGFPGGCDKSIHWLLTYCIHKAIEMGYPPRDGWCWGYYVKDIAKTNIPSNHGKGGGRAIDYNAPENGRGTKPKQYAMPVKVAEVFERNGFNWGGRWEFTDPMHFEALKSRLWYFRRTRQMKRLVKKQRG